MRQHIMVAAGGQQKTVDFESLWHVFSVHPPTESRELEMSERLKEGHVREDGMVFWRNHKTKGQIWITRETFEHRKRQRVEYRKRCLELHKQIRSKKSPMDIPYFGKYDFSKNRYYAGVSASGKDLWITKEKLERLRLQHQKSKINYIERAKALPDTGLRVGDPHPEKTGLYVIFKVGNKVFFGDEDRLKRRLDSVKMILRKRDIKCQKIRKDLLSKLDNRLRRGHRDHSTGLVFWEYGKTAKPVWLSPEVYEAKIAAEREKKKRRRQAAKSTLLSEQASLCSSDT